MAVGGIFAAATFSYLALAVFPPTWVLAMIAATGAFGLWLLLLRSGRDFGVLFLVLVLIGYFQGYIDRVTSERLPQSVWGLAKYALIGLIIAGFAMRVVQGRRVAATQAFAAWIGLWLANTTILAALILEAMRVSAYYSPVGTIQEFGVGNMLLAALVYFLARPEQVYRCSRLLVGMGAVAAAFGVIQRLLGPARLAIFGLSTDAVLASRSFLNADNPQTGFLDLQNGFRAFSFFDTQFAFSAFLVIAIIALQTLRLRGRVRVRPYLLLMSILWAGLSVTFNLTNFLTCLLALSLLSLLQRGVRSKSFFAVLFNRRFWQATAGAAVVVFLVVLAIPSLRDRVSGVFDVRQGSATAGGSLAYRLEGATSGIQAIADYPLGFGLFLNGTGMPSNPELDRYARINDYFSSHGVFFSGDNWFQWLMVQTGLPTFVLYVALFLVPILWGLYWRNRIQNNDLRLLLQGSLALVIATFVAGVSNSPILTFPPSNLLFWAVVGALFKAPVWDRELEQASRAHRN